MFGLTDGWSLPAKVDVATPSISMVAMPISVVLVTGTICCRIHDKHSDARRLGLGKVLRPFRRK